MGMGRRRVRGHQIKEPRVPGRACLALSRRRSRPGATRRGKRITPTARRDPGRGAWLLDEEGAVALTGGLARARVAHSAEAARAERSRAEWNRDRSSRGRRREEGRWRVGPGGQRGRRVSGRRAGAGGRRLTRGPELSAGLRASVRCGRGAILACGCCGAARASWGAGRRAQRDGGAGRGLAEPARQRQERGEGARCVTGPSGATWRGGELGRAVV